MRRPACRTASAARQAVSPWVADRPAPVRREGDAGVARREATPRSTSARTIAAFSLPSLRISASGSSMRFRASCGWARGWASATGSATMPSSAPSMRCASAARRWRRRMCARARLVATEACRLAENGPAFIERVREELDLDARDRRPQDGGLSRRHGLRLARRSQGAFGHRVRYRRRLDGDRLARRPGAACLRRSLQAHPRLGFAARRRGDAGRAPRRHRSHAGELSRAWSRR